MRIENRIIELGYTLPESSPAGGLYTPVRRVGNVLYVSGQIPWLDGEVKYSGKVGNERNIEYAQEAARLCILNMLAAVKNAIGDLDKIKQIVKLTVMVSSETGFDKQHIVANGASQLLIDIFGPDGCAARSAIGVNQLPLNVTVEIEGIIEVEE
ncbi:MAG: RidA family protein [Clostridiaceae bacterium]|nr:RidA family protein [Clostridiaceae bacterium]